MQRNLKYKNFNKQLIIYYRNIAMLMYINVIIIFYYETNCYHKNKRKKLNA